MTQETILTANSDLIEVKISKEFIGKKIRVVTTTIDDAENKISSEANQTYLASHDSLSKEWLTAEEDEAWRSL